VDKSVRKPTLVVVDVLVKVRPIGKSGRSAYELDYEALAGLHRLAHELGIAVIVLHHTLCCTNSTNRFSAKRRVCVRATTKAPASAYAKALPWLKTTWVQCAWAAV
jgi:RecA-family ATPase